MLEAFEVASPHTNLQQLDHFFAALAHLDEQEEFQEESYELRHCDVPLSFESQMQFPCTSGQRAATFYRGGSSVSMQDEGLCELQWSLPTSARQSTTIPSRQTSGGGQHSGGTDSRMRGTCEERLRLKLAAREKRASVQLAASIAQQPGQGSSAAAADEGVSADAVRAEVHRQRKGRSSLDKRDQRQLLLPDERGRLVMWCGEHGLNGAGEEVRKAISRKVLHLLHERPLGVPTTEKEESFLKEASLKGTKMEATKKWVQDIIGEAKHMVCRLPTVTHVSQASPK